MNIIVLTIGCSGSSILVKMLQQLGWRTPYSDKEYAECVPFRELNQKILQKTYQTKELYELIEVFPSNPWVIKDPRLIMTFATWKPILDNSKNCLLYLSRDADKIENSLMRRGWGTVYNGKQHLYRRSMTTLQKLALQHLDSWSGPKIHIDFNQLKSAISLFDIKRG